jgi:hypothetical protein
MREEFLFNSEEEFCAKLREVSQSGVDRRKIRTITPYFVYELDEIIQAPASNLKFFTLFGAVLGFITGMSLTIYTVLSWPLITGGKPFISLPPFLIIGFEMTILLGGVTSFLGFLLIARLPRIKDMAPDKEYGNQFVIVVEKE